MEQLRATEERLVAAQSALFSAGLNVQVTAATTAATATTTATAIEAMNPAAAVVDIVGRGGNVTKADIYRPGPALSVAVPRARGR